MRIIIIVVMIGYILAVFTFAVSLLHLVGLGCVIGFYRNFKYFYPIAETFYHYLQVIVFISAMIFCVLTILNTATDGCCEEGGHGTWVFFLSYLAGHI